MKINISKNKFKEKHKGGCKNSEKNNMNFIVQSIANMISIYNITSYPDDSCFNKKKNSFIMI